MKPNWQQLGTALTSAARDFAVGNGYRLAMEFSNETATQWELDAMKKMAIAFEMTGYRLTKISTTEKKPEPPALSGCPVCGFHHPPDGVCLV